MSACFIFDKATASDRQNGCSYKVNFRLFKTVAHTWSISVYSQTVPFTFIGCFHGRLRLDFTFCSKLLKIVFFSFHLRQLSLPPQRLAFTVASAWPSRGSCRDAIRNSFSRKRLGVYFSAAEFSYVFYLYGRTLCVSFSIVFFGAADFSLNF